MDFLVLVELALELAVAEAATIFLKDIMYGYAGGNETDGKVYIELD